MSWSSPSRHWWLFASSTGSRHESQILDFDNGLRQDHSIFVKSSNRPHVFFNSRVFAESTHIRLHGNCKLRRLIRYGAAGTQFQPFTLLIDTLSMVLVIFTSDIYPGNVLEIFIALATWLFLCIQMIFTYHQINPKSCSSAAPVQ
jgi:hypothetical protein